MKYIHNFQKLVGVFILVVFTAHVCVAKKKDKELEPQEKAQLLKDRTLLVVLSNHYEVDYAMMKSLKEEYTFSEFEFILPENYENYKYDESFAFCVVGTNPYTSTQRVRNEWALVYANRIVGKDTLSETLFSYYLGSTITANYFPPTDNKAVYVPLFVRSLQGTMEHYISGGEEDDKKNNLYGVNVLFGDHTRKTVRQRMFLVSRTEFRKEDDLSRLKTHKVFRRTFGKKLSVRYQFVPESDIVKAIDKKDEKVYVLNVGYYRIYRRKKRLNMFFHLSDPVTGEIVMKGMTR